MDGWITLHRKLLDWEWYDDIPVKVLFLHLLLKANYQPTQWRGQTIDEGELRTSVCSLSEETGMSERQIRTALSKLESTGEIVRKTTNKYTLVKVQNYGKYQGYDIDQATNKRQTKDKQKTNKRQTKDKQAYYINNNITNKQDNNITSITSDAPAREAIWEYAPDVLMTDEQACKLIDWCSPEELEQYVVNLQEYIENGHKVHNCFETICRWKERDSTTRRTNNDRV